MRPPHRHRFGKRHRENQEEPNRREHFRHGRERWEQWEQWGKERGWENWVKWEKNHEGRQEAWIRGEHVRHLRHGGRRERGGRHWSAWYREHHNRRQRFLFFRLLTLFGFIALFLLAGIFVLTSLVVFISQLPFYVWLLILALGLSLNAIAWQLARRAFRDFTNPLTTLIEAAEEIASGNLEISVPAGMPGDFGRLAQTFNRMVVELARTDRQRRNLTADVAHELRTPIHILQGNIEGLLDGVYEPSAEHFNLLLDETRWLGRLVEDLRTLSLAETGQLPLYKESVAVSDLLSSVATNFRGAIQNASLELEVSPVPAAEIEADAGRLEQVLGNLVLNGIQHTPPGGKIRLSASVSNEKVKILVQDSGKGIAPENLPYIFDRFWREDSARTRKEGSGSGLGLAIAKQLVEAHAGLISVESQLGRGTTFSIELPLATLSDQNHH